ncbi:MAG: hypothetical protein ABJA93_13090 [Sporichthyaceae bacterium]
MTTARDVPRQGAADVAATEGPVAAAGQVAPEDPRPIDLMRFITSIGSPIALATSLLFYFGWVRSEEQARAFGADASVFAMSTQDYVLRSINVLFFPIILMLLVALLVLRVDRALRSGPAGRRWLEPLARGLQWSWALFLPLGLVLHEVAGRFGDVALPMWVALSIVAPAYGTVLRRLAAVDRRRVSRVAMGLLLALVTVLLFWQTERLASLGGQELARDLKDNLGSKLTRVQLYSVTDLHIQGPGVTASSLGGKEGEYAYQYSGLYLLQRSGDKYFLLTDGWNENQGRLVVLPDNSGIRVEFGP